VTTYRLHKSLQVVNVPGIGTDRKYAHLMSSMCYLQFANMISVHDILHLLFFLSKCVHLRYLCDAVVHKSFCKPPCCKQQKLLKCQQTPRQDLYDIYELGLLFANYLS